ncbi:MAG: Gx transporter family protein [Clostridiales bacterium]|nr:Gx transporter family protein [Clostridiales bacterium]
MASSDKQSLPVRRLLALSMLVAMELALAAAESLIPPFLPLPGIKLGLPNIVTLAAFSLAPKRQVLLVVLARHTLAGLVLGNFFSPAFWIGFGASVLSFFVMAALYGIRHFSVVGVSLAGAASHNAGQLMIVWLILNNPGIYYYIPMLLLWSVPMGLFTGFSAMWVISALSKAGINDKL